MVPDASNGPVHKNRGDSLSQWESFHRVWRHNIKDMFDEEMDAAAQPDLFTDPLVVLPKTTQGRLGEIFDQHPWLGVNRVRNITNHPVMFPLFEEWRQDRYPDVRPFGERPRRHTKQHCEFLQEMMEGDFARMIMIVFLCCFRCVRDFCDMRAASRHMIQPR